MELETMVRRLATHACAALLTMAATASAAELHVMISAGFSEAYSDLAPAFERATAHRLITVRGPSMGDSPEAIPSRLKRGEPADLVIMVGAAVDDLERQGLVKAASKVDLARSQIGMVVRAGAAKPDITSVEAFRHALLDAKSIAYSDSASGLYLSNTLFPRLGVADQAAGKSRKIKGPPSGEPVAAVVARGEAEIGFQQVSELLHASGISYVGPIPAELQQETFYSAAIATGAKQSDAAIALIRFLVSPEAAPAMLKSGLAPLAAQ
jgi:molybdate transport system substrate-binding protein